MVTYFLITMSDSGAHFPSLILNFLVPVHIFVRHKSQGLFLLTTKEGFNENINLIWNKGRLHDLIRILFIWPFK